MARIDIDLSGLSDLHIATERIQSQFQTVGAGINQAFERLDTVPDSVSRLDAVFAQAGQSLSDALSRAARSGELDFRSMAEAILADFARIAAEAVVTRGAVSNMTAPMVNLNMSLGAGSDAASIIGASGNISTAIARAVALGGRFL